MTDDSTRAGPDAEPDPYLVTKEIALKALDRRAYGRVELANYLARKGAPEEAVDRVLGRFEEVGLLDDAAFAKQWVDSRYRGRKLPRRTLVAELHRKGLDADVIAEAVAPIDRDAEARVAAELAAAKARSLAGQPYEIALRRLVGVLGRRGYAGDLAWQAAKEALSERPDVDLEMGEQVDLHPKG